MRLQRFFGALAAAVLLAAPAARADVRFDVRLSEFGYALTDLTPDDGQAPGISFGDMVYSLSGSVREGPVRPYQDETQASSYLTRRLWPAAGAVTRRADAPYSHIESGISGQLADHSLGAFVAAQVSGNRSDPTHASLVSGGSTPVSLLLTLAPGTEVVWTGHVAASLQSTQGRRGKRSAEASTGIGMTLRMEDFSQTFDSFSARLVLEPGMAGRKRLDTDFDLVLSNPGSSALTARLEGGVGGESRAFFPVPEPAAPLLGLCGAGVLAVALRGRRRRPTASSPFGASPCHASS